MFELATPNLRVNGQNFEEYVEKPSESTLKGLAPGGY